MQKILKRLELIKTAITIEDEEIIELQVMKLNTMECSEEVIEILTKLDDKDYGNVVVEIERYLERYSGVVVYEDKELQGLRLELKALEKKLEELSSQKNEYLNDIHEFNVQYHLHLGEIIQKILHIKEELLYEAMQEKKEAFEDLKSAYEDLKAEKEELKSKKEKLEKELEEMDEFDDGYDELYEELQELKEELDEKEAELNEKRKETKDAKKEFEEDEVTQEYEDVKQDSEEFSKEYKEVKEEDRFEITDEEKKELKQLFRKASKLCHPDIVSDELKEQAHEIMQKLNEAYSKRDLQTVKEILISLESGNGFDVASDTIDDKDLLREKINEIRNSINQNESEIEEIKEEEAIHIIEEYEDIENYFNFIKEQLQKEYENLQGILLNNDSNAEADNEISESSYDDEEYKSTTSIAREKEIDSKQFIEYLISEGYVYRDINNSLTLSEKGESLQAKYRSKDNAIWIIWPDGSLDEIIFQFKEKYASQDNDEDSYWEDEF